MKYLKQNESYGRTIFELIEDSDRDFFLVWANGEVDL